MSNQVRKLAFVAILVGSCGGDSGREVKNPNQNPTNQNPATNADLGLKILLEAVATDEGNFLYELKMTMKEKVPDQDLKWSDPLLFGERFAVRIGESPQMLMVLNHNTSTYSTPASMMMSGSAFRALHNKQVMVYRVDHLDQALPNFDSSTIPAVPPALAAYPVVDFPHLESRIISNCVGNPGAPDRIRWESFTNRSLSLSFQTLAGAELKKVSVPDQSFWQVSNDIFQTYFTAPEILDLQDPSGGAGYGVSTHNGRMALTRSIPARYIKVGIAKLSIEVTSTEIANYGFEFQGGCQ